MAKRVVDVLEMVEIDNENAESVCAVFGVLDGKA